MTEINYASVAPAILLRMPPPLPFALAAPLRLPLSLLPDRLQAALLAQLTNHLLRGQTLAHRLPILDGRSVEIHVTDAGARLRFAIRGGRLVAGATPADVVIAGTLEAFWQLATRAEDPDTLFFHRRLAIEGDTETGLTVKNLLDALEYDWRAHCHDVLGPELAGRLAPLARRLGQLAAAGGGRRPS